MEYVGRGAAITATLSVLALSSPSIAAAATRTVAEGSTSVELGSGFNAVVGPGGALTTVVREPGSPTPSASVATKQGTAPDAGNSRVGGSDPSPAPRKPGWVWWVAGAFLVMLGAGGFRLWRSTLDSEATESRQPTEEPPSDRFGADD
jgi:hypothetical protein